MAVSFTKEENKDLSVVSGKLADARKENTALRNELNDSRNAVADSTAVKESVRADAAEEKLAQRDRQLAETTKALKQATAGNDRLKAQAERVEVVLTKGFEQIVKQLSV